MRPFDTTRPGLLVLDPDGRRVASIPLAGTPEVTDVVSRLKDALTAKPREQFLLRVAEEKAEAFAEGLAGLEHAGQLAVRPGGQVELRTAAGVVTPREIQAVAKRIGVKVEFVDPVPVAITSEKGALEAQKIARAVPGSWHTTHSKKTCVAYIARWLLHPRELTSRGLSGDIASVVYRFENLPKGARVVSHLRRPLTQKGVLSVIPRVEEGAIEVIVRPKVHDADKTLQVLEDKGLKRRP